MNGSGSGSGSTDNSNQGGVSGAKSSSASGKPSEDEGSDAEAQGAIEAPSKHFQVGAGQGSTDATNKKMKQLILTAHRANIKSLKDDITNWLANKGLQTSVSDALSSFWKKSSGGRSNLLDNHLSKSDFGKLFGKLLFGSAEIFLRMLPLYGPVAPGGGHDGEGTMMSRSTGRTNLLVNKIWNGEELRGWYTRINSQTTANSGSNSYAESITNNLNRAMCVAIYFARKWFSSHENSLPGEGYLMEHVSENGAFWRVLFVEEGGEVRRKLFLEAWRARFTRRKQTSFLEMEMVMASQHDHESWPPVSIDPEEYLKFVEEHKKEWFGCKTEERALKKF